MQNLLMRCRAIVDAAGSIDIASGRANCAAGYRPGIDKQSTWGQRFFHVDIRLVALRKLLAYKALASTIGSMIDKFFGLITTATIYKE